MKQHRAFGLCHGCSSLCERRWGIALGIRREQVAHLPVPSAGPRGHHREATGGRSVKAAPTDLSTKLMSGGWAKESTWASLELNPETCLGVHQSKWLWWLKPASRCASQWSCGNSLVWEVFANPGMQRKQELCMEKSAVPGSESHTLRSTAPRSCLIFTQRFAGQRCVGGERFGWSGLASAALGFAWVLDF